MKTTDAPLQQSGCNNSCLNEGNPVDRLLAQWHASMHVQAALRDGEAAVVHKAVAEMDLVLIRHALAMLRNHLREAATHDCAQLLTERILDTDPKQPSLARWETWLTAAPFWPKLALECWREAQGEALEMIVEQLAKTGISVERYGHLAMRKLILELKITDVLSEDLVRRVFLPGDDDDGTEIEF